MNVNVLVFGQIADITGKESLSITGVASTDELVQLLQQKYSGLKELKYLVAVNKKIIQQSTELKDNDTVALLPPFSGG